MQEPKIDHRTRLIAAAVRCFERDGIRQTNMSSIAKDAGLSRNTVYRSFGNRSALLLGVVEHRIRAINTHLNEVFVRYETLEEALTDGVIYSAQASKNDKLFNALVIESTDRNIEALIFGSNADIREIFAMTWTPLIERARANGELRSTLPNERLLEGIRYFISVLIVRTEQSETEQEQFLRDFLLPVFLERGLNRAAIIHRE